jgi:hypothetical protein
MGYGSAKTGETYMREIANLIGAWTLPALMFGIGGWVFIDMLVDTVREIRKRMRS